MPQIKQRFINAEYLRAWSGLDLNINEKILSPIIIRADEEYLRKVLGSGIYSEVKGQMTASALTTTNQTLLELIKPCSAAYTMYLIPNAINYKYTDAGITKHKSETSEAISRTEVADVKSEWLNTAQELAQNITNYLIDNSSSYPLFLNPGSGASVVMPSRIDYHYGIYTSGGSENIPGRDNYDGTIYT